MAPRSADPWDKNAISLYLPGDRVLGQIHGATGRCWLPKGNWRQNLPGQGPPPTWDSRHCMSALALYRSWLSQWL